jgi:hypothetical protein
MTSITSGYMKCVDSASRGMGGLVLCVWCFLGLDLIYVYFVKSISIVVGSDIADLVGKVLSSGQIGKRFEDSNNSVRSIKSPQS